MTDDWNEPDTGCATCPRCRMRRKIQAAIANDDVLRSQLLEALLDAVEGVRAAESSDDEDENPDAAVAAEQVLELLDCVHQVAAASDD